MLTNMTVYCTTILCTIWAGCQSYCICSLDCYYIFLPHMNCLTHFSVIRTYSHYTTLYSTILYVILTYRFFKKPIHNDLVEIVLKRVKCMLGYPESRPEMITPNSVLYRYYICILYYTASSYVLCVYIINLTH